MSTNVFSRSLNTDSLQAVRAESNYIYRNNGQKLLDGSCGASVSSTGHGNKRVIASALEHYETLDYVFSNTFANSVITRGLLNCCTVMKAIMDSFSQLKD